MCPSVGGSVPVSEGVPQCGRVCPTEGGCAQFGGVSQCGRVCPNVGGYAPVREGVPSTCGVCPSVRGCAPLWEGMLMYI